MDIDEQIAKATFQILENQEPLGEEFQKILDDNRWDLYESNTTLALCTTLIVSSRNK